jgi:hypothetical protein
LPAPARAIIDAPKEVKLRHIGNCLKADPAYGKGVADALGIPSVRWQNNNRIGLAGVSKISAIGPVRQSWKIMDHAPAHELTRVGGSCRRPFCCGSPFRSMQALPGDPVQGMPGKWAYPEMLSLNEPTASVGR